MKTAVFGSSAAAIYTAKTLSEHSETQLVTQSEITSDYFKTIPPELMRGKYDMIILTEDADNKALAWQVGQFLKTDGNIITLQPSSPETELYNYFGSNRVAFGAYSSEKITLQDSECARKISSLLKADISDNIIINRFTKMCEAAFGGICSIAGCSMEMITSNETWMELMANIVKEFTLICADEQIYDITLNGYLPADLLTKKGFIKKNYPVKKIIAAIPDYSNRTPVNEYASIVAYSNKNGLASPLCEKVLEILLKISKGELNRGPQNITLFK